MSTAYVNEQPDRPAFGRVGELKSAFESATNTTHRDDSNKYRTSIATGLTEERRKVFEQQEHTPIMHRTVRNPSTE
jgi:hypothetical protein